MKEKNTKQAELKEKDLSQVTGGAGYHEANWPVAPAAPADRRNRIACDPIDDGRIVPR